VTSSTPQTGPYWSCPLASICFVYAIFGWSGVAFIGGVVAVLVSLLIALNRR
jgi:hypothetical protein